MNNFCNFGNAAQDLSAVLQIYILGKAVKLTKTDADDKLLETVKKAIEAR